MWAWGSFGMVLDGKDGVLPVPEPFVGLVVEIDVCDFALGFDAFRIHCEVVVL